MLAPHAGRGEHSIEKVHHKRTVYDLHGLLDLRHLLPEHCVHLVFDDPGGCLHQQQRCHRPGIGRIHGRLHQVGAIERGDDEAEVAQVDAVLVKDLRGRHAGRLGVLSHVLQHVQPTLGHHVVHQVLRGHVDVLLVLAPPLVLDHETRICVGAEPGLVPRQELPAEELKQVAVPELAIGSHGRHDAPKVQQVELAVVPDVPLHVSPRPQLLGVPLARPALVGPQVEPLPAVPHHLGEPFVRLHHRLPRVA
mmetsp:Transcript_11980/g.33769  ORF Transcript_11980/g.33769 Transcript_11980/m.33769 type:complete len:250 (+) Transcript_11980:284-1033(+)